MAKPPSIAQQAAAVAPATGAFPALGARRLLVIGGVALILLGMAFGDIFAVFVLHQNAGRISEGLLAATGAVVIHDAGSIPNDFAAIGGLLENRGTKVDAHVHIIDFGYLALLLALVQPYVLLSERWKKRLAALFLIGAALLPVGVFLIHYVGLTYSPLEAIGWASIFADCGGLLVLSASAGELLGMWKYFQRAQVKPATDPLLADRSWAGRALLAGGTALVLAGFLHGGYYAGLLLYSHEARESAQLASMTSEAAANHPTAAAQAVAAYGNLQGEKAVNIAAHAHIIEFGMLAILLAFFQPLVFLAERWKRIWAVVLLAGSVALPSFVLLELRLGLLAGGLADFGGLLVIVALLGMLVGVLRYTGRLDAAAGVGR